MQHQGMHEKTWVHARRRIFFEEILAAIQSPPTEIDFLLNGAGHYVEPKPASVVIDSERGTLYTEIVFKTEQREIDFAYSVFQIGRDIKVGILMRPEHGAAIRSDLFDGVWAGTKPDFSLRGDNLLWDWSFDEPGLFERWTLQERYVLGCRHMHFRVLNLLWNAFAMSRFEFEDEPSSKEAVNVSQVLASAVGRKTAQAAETMG